MPLWTPIIWRILCSDKKNFDDSHRGFATFTCVGPGAGGIGGLLALVDNGAVYRYFYDVNGNVGQLLDESGGIATRYEYDAFGKTIFSGGSYSEKNPFRFSTKYFDVETGFYYYGFRYYLVELGRWNRKDPIGEKGGINIYAFIKNNSIDNIDRLGLQIDTYLETNSEPSPFHFDDRGWELFSHWMNGEGKPLIFENNKRWSNYMKANNTLKSQLQPKLKHDAIRRMLNTISGAVKIVLVNYIEIENGYRTGYQLLHGPDPYFTITSNKEPSTVRRFGGCGLLYNVIFTWYDEIDPNYKYPGDIALAGLFKFFGSPKNYSIKISWESQFEIRKEKNRLEGYGYPFDNSIYFWKNGDK